MAKQYTPRRANRQRWLKEAPDYILDVFDDKKSGDRYTVFFTTAMSPFVGSYAETVIAYLGMSGAPSHPQGVSMWGELDAHQAAGYRYEKGHQRIRWLDLPENIRAHVIARATSES